MTKNSELFGKKIVVTGSDGFVGGAMIKALQERSAEVISVSRSTGHDLLNREDVLKAFKGAHTVFHCAAVDGNSAFKVKHSAEILDANIRMTSNVIHSVVGNNIPRLVMMSSADIYPLGAPRPLKEHDDYQVFVDSSESGYTLSKRYSEILARQFSKQFEFELLIVRPNNIYGPTDTKLRIIPVLVKNILSGQPVTLVNNGEQERNFIFIDDFINVLLKLEEEKITGTLNIASAETITLLQLANLIAKLSHSQLTVKNMEMPNEMSRSQVLSVDKLLALLDFRFTSLEDGLKAIITNLKEK